MGGTANGSLRQAEDSRSRNVMELDRLTVFGSVPKHSPVQQSPKLGSAQLSGAHWQC